MKRCFHMFLLIALLALVLLMAVDTEGQCAMCKATAESSQKVDEGQQAGGGINKGILYIMFVPYSLLMVLFGVFFRDRIKGFLKELGVFK